MSVWQETLSIETDGRRLYMITNEVLQLLPELPEKGLLNCFVQHTSCSLIIQENADPTAREDLESFALRLAPDDQSWHRHTLEGPDDSSAHMKAASFGASLNVPIIDKKLGLGTWQGIFLWEHRMQPHQRRVTLTILT